jgi:hypothetical protein
MAHIYSRYSVIETYVGNDQFTIDFERAKVISGFLRNATVSGVIPRACVTPIFCHPPTSTMKNSHSSPTVHKENLKEPILRPMTGVNKALAIPFVLEEIIDFYDYAACSVLQDRVSARERLCVYRTTSVSNYVPDQCRSSHIKALVKIQRVSRTWRAIAIRLLWHSYVKVETLWSNMTSPLHLNANYWIKDYKNYSVNPNISSLCKATHTAADSQNASRNTIRPNNGAGTLDTSGSCALPDLINLIWPIAPSFSQYYR